MESDTSGIYVKSVTYKKVGSIHAEDSFEFVNTYNVPETGRLAISKKITGSMPGSRAMDYQFEVKGPDQVANQTYIVEGSNEDSITFDSDSLGTVTIKGADTALIYGLPAETYTVKEIGTSVDIGNYTHEVKYDPENGTVEIPNQGSVTVTITNEYIEQVGNLQIIKAITGNASKDTTDKKNYIFKIKGSEANAGKNYKTEDGRFIAFTKEAPYIATISVIGPNSVKILNLPIGPYTITEDDESTTINGYTHTVTGTDTPPVVETGKDTQITITNNYSKNENELTTGSLIVSKTVLGGQGETDREFNFKVTLSDTTINGTYGDMEFVNGVANFSLKHNFEKKATGLPVGITYTVVEAEANKDGYGTVGNNSNGSILEDTDAFAQFINSKPALFGDLLVTKTVSGTNGEMTRPFNFTVTLSDNTINDTYGDMTFTNGVAEFTLKHGESAKATGLPAGVTHTVTEAEANKEGYTTSRDGDPDGSAIEAGEEHQVNFENHRDNDNLVEEDENVSLSIIKKVSGVEVASGKTFKFTTILKLPETYNGEMVFPYEITNGSDIRDSGSITIESADKTVEKVFELQANDLLKISDLPVGTDYKVVEEKDPEYNWSVEINGVSSADATSSATLNKDLVLTYLNKIETTADKPNNSTTPNPTPKTGRLVLSKLITGNAPSALTQNKLFTFEITAPYSLAGQTYTTITDSGSVGNLTFSSNKATVTLRGAQRITVLDLPFGTYSVSESPLGAGLEGYNWSMNILPVNGLVSVSETVSEALVTVTNNYTLTNESDKSDYEEPEDIPEDEEQITPNGDPVKITKEQSVTRHNSEGYSQSSDGIRTTGYIEVRENDIITYYLTVSNQSAEPIRNVVITDPVPDGLILVSNSATLPNNLTISGNTLTWRIAEIGAYQNTAVQMQFQVKIPQINEEIYWKNIAYVDYDDNTHGPWSSNEVVVGDPPANTNQSTNNNSASTTSTTTSSPQNTATRTNVTTVGVSPQTGVAGGLSIVFLTAIAGSASCIEYYNRKRKNKNK